MYSSNLHEQAHICTQQQPSVRRWWWVLVDNAASSYLILSSASPCSSQPWLWVSLNPHLCCLFLNQSRVQLPPSCLCTLCCSVQEPSEYSPCCPHHSHCSSDQDAAMAKITGSTVLPFFSELTFGKQDFYARVAPPWASSWFVLLLVLKVWSRAESRSIGITWELV